MSVAVRFDNNASGSSTTLPIAVSLTTGSEDNGCVIIGVAAAFTGTGNIGTVDYNGTTATQLVAVQVSDGGGNITAAALFAVPFPTTGTHNINVAAGSGTLRGVVVVGSSWFGVDSINVIYQKDKNSGSGTGPTSTASCHAMSFAVDMLAAQRVLTAVTATAGGSQTDIGNLSVGTPGVRGAGSYLQGADAATTMSWTLSTSTNWAHCMVGLMPAIRTLATMGAGI